MPWYTIIVALEGQPPTATVVEADAREDGPTSVRFLRDGRVVYQVPADGLSRAECHTDRPAAAAAARAFRDRRHGAATIHVTESASPAPRRRKGQPAGSGLFEALTIRIDEGTGRR